MSTINTDRELLELAAKAMKFDWQEWAGDMLFVWDRTIQMVWRPLTDDGDALRLAVKLGMLHPWGRGHDLFQRFYREELEKDQRPTEATCRAIVRAAAEIGKAMP